MTSHAAAAADQMGERAPVRPPQRRLIGVDATRGLALLGMMAVHIMPGQDADGTTSTTYLLTHGRAAATFAVLAGVGLALASGGRTPPTGRVWAGHAAATLVRALAIGAVGLWLGYTDSGVAIILAYYAVLFVFAGPLLGLRSGPLAILAGGIAVGMPLLSHEWRRGLPGLDPANPTFGDLATPVELLRTLTLTGYYPALAWTAYLCAGLAIGRLDLRSPKVAAALLIGGITLAGAAVLTSALLLGSGGGRAEIAATEGVSIEQLDAKLSQGFFGTTPPTTGWWMAIWSAHSTTPLDLLHTTGTAIALLGAILLLVRVAAALLLPLAAAGSMTLSLYTLHVLFLGSGQAPADPATSWLLQAALALTLATAWKSGFPRGPLETVVAAAADPLRRVVAGTGRTRTLRR